MNSQPGYLVVGVCLDGQAIRGGVAMRAPRRHFLFGSLAAMAGGVSPRLSAAANETVVLGFMGVRGRGNDLIKYFGKRHDVEIAYLADVDTRLLPRRAAGVESM